MRSIFLILFSCLLFAACSSDDDKKITSIEPEFTRVELEPGGGIPFTLKHHPLSAPTPQYGFESNNQYAMATYHESADYKGYMIAACANCGEGTTIITIVTDEWIEAKIEVIVKKKTN